MKAWPPSLLWLVWLALAGCGTLAVRRWLLRGKKRRRARRARRGELDAEQVLLRAGYRVQAAQLRRPMVVLDDGKPVEMSVVADYLVEKGGRRWVAEVKTGRLAQSLRHAPTRRQLLEYRICYRAAGVLLVDPELERVRRVEFPGLDAAHGGRRGWLWLAMALGAGVALGAWGERWRRSRN